MIKTDSELTMAISSAFNSIINQFQLSNLNFAIKMTPFAAYITMKKSTQIDKNRGHLSPSPPVWGPIEQAMNKKMAAESEIVGLRSTIQILEEEVHKLSTKNRSLNEELSTVKNALVTSLAANELFETKLEQKEKDMNKVVN